MELRLTNDRVDPPILVKGLVTKKTSTYSENLFCDPSDPEEAAFYDDDLTPVEKGHVYLWKETNTGEIHVHMPFRIMDSVTASFLVSLNSFKSLRPYIARNIPQVLVRKMRSCLQDFSISKTDFKIFSSRVISNGGIIEKDEVNLESLLSEIELLVTDSAKLISDIQALREKRCSVTSELKILTQEDLDSVLKEFAWFREMISEVKNRQGGIAKLLDKLSMEVGRDTDYVRASSETDRINAAVNALNRVNFSRFEREAIHKFRVDSEQVDPFSIPAHIGTLSHELGQLGQWFPSLSKISVHGDNVVVNLTGLKIILTSSGVKVEGDPAALKTYMGTSGAVATEGAPKRRRRNIAAKTKN